MAAGWGDYPQSVDTPLGTMVLMGFKRHFQSTVHMDHRYPPPDSHEGPVYRLIERKN